MENNATRESFGAIVIEIVFACSIRDAALCRDWTLWRFEGIRFTLSSKGTFNEYLFNISQTCGGQTQGLLVY